MSQSFNRITGEPCAWKLASTVRGGADGKGNAVGFTSQQGHPNELRHKPKTLASRLPYEDGASDARSQRGPAAGLAGARLRVEPADELRAGQSANHRQAEHREQGSPGCGQGRETWRPPADSIALRARIQPSQSPGFRRRR